MDEHIEDNVGELLPHVFLADATRLLISFFGEGLSAWGQLQDVLDFLEGSFRDGDDETKELIAVSFLENLPVDGELGSGIRELLGPELRAESEHLRR